MPVLVKISNASSRSKSGPLLRRWKKEFYGRADSEGSSCLWSEQGVPCARRCVGSNLVLKEIQALDMGRPIQEGDGQLLIFKVQSSQETPILRDRCSLHPSSH